METKMTFKQRAESFLLEIQSRRRNPVKSATVEAYRSRLNAHILPRLGSLQLATIENGTLKTFVAALSEQKLSPAAINAVVSLVKEVIASAVDANGNEMYPRTWNSDFIDLPVVNPRTQTAPVATPKAVQKALGQAIGQDKALIALLAGSGLRIGEALALMVGPDDGQNSFWQPETATVTIRSTLTPEGIQLTPKTEAGIRQVDLAPELNTFLCTMLLDSELPGSGLLFTSKTGGTMRVASAYDNLRRAGFQDGFHAFRRFRLTHLDGSGVPRGLVKFWAGHAAKDVTERYIRSGESLEERKTWARKAGLGFQLEA
jgi:integrase